MKVIFTFFIFCFNLAYTHAQYWEALGAGFNGFSNTLVKDKLGILYTAGNFSQNGGPYVVKFVAGRWTNVGVFNGFGGVISEITFDSKGNLYAVGGFRNAQLGYFVAKYDGTTWAQVGANFNEHIFTIYVDANDNLYIGGFFTNDKGQRYVAKWNGTAWSEVGFGSNTSNITGRIRAIRGDKQGNIYAGGEFTNTTSNAYVAKWNGTTWSELGKVEGTLIDKSGAIYSIKIDIDNNIYASGSIGNGQSSVVMKFDGATWSQVGTPLLGYFDEIASDAQGNVYGVGGLAEQTDKGMSFNVVKWDGSKWLIISDESSYFYSKSQIYALLIDAAGEIYTNEVISPDVSFIVRYKPSVTSLNFTDKKGEAYAFPNPVTDILNIESPSGCTINIVTSLGKVIVEQWIEAGKNNILLDFLDKGIYTVHLNNGTSRPPLD